MASDEKAPDATAVRRSSGAGRRGSDPNSEQHVAPVQKHSKGCSPGQQMKPDWSLSSVVICSGCFGCIFISLGLVAFVTMSASKTVTFDYTHLYPNNYRSFEVVTTDTDVVKVGLPKEEWVLEDANAKVVIDTDLTAPVYVYYTMDWLFQNHKDMMMDVDTYTQLAGPKEGENRKDSELQCPGSPDCGSYTDTRGESSKSYPIGADSKPYRRRYPQGWNAGLVYDDTIFMDYCPEAGTCDGQSATNEWVPLQLDESHVNISWQQDLERWNNLNPAQVATGDAVSTCYDQTSPFASRTCMWQEQFDMWILETFAPRVCRIQEDKRIAYLKGQSAVTWYVATKKWCLAAKVAVDVDVDVEVPVLVDCDETEVPPCAENGKKEKKVDCVQADVDAGVCDGNNQKTETQIEKQTTQVHQCPADQEVELLDCSPTSSDTSEVDMWNDVSKMKCTFTNNLTHRSDSTFHRTDCGSNNLLDYEDVPNPSGWGIENAHFVNWARPSGLSPIRKEYAKIDMDLPSGSEIRVNSDMAWTEGGNKTDDSRTKYLEFSSMSSFGAANFSVWVIPLGTGALWALTAVGFLFIYQYSKWTDKSKRHQFVWERQPADRTHTNVA